MFNGYMHHLIQKIIIYHCEKSGSATAKRCNILNIRLVLRSVCLPHSAYPKSKPCHSALIRKSVLKLP